MRFQRCVADFSCSLRDLKGDWHEYESKIERRKDQKKRHDERKKVKEAKEAERKRSSQQPDGGAGAGEAPNSSEGGHSKQKSDEEMNPVSEPKGSRSEE